MLRTISILIAACFCIVALSLHGQTAPQQKKTPYPRKITKGTEYRKASETSKLFAMDSMVWCRKVSEQFVPFEHVQEFKKNETVVLWLRLKGDQNSLNALRQGPHQPAYVKFFRAASYGLTPERLTKEKSELNFQPELVDSKLEQFEVSVKKENYFFVHVWTEPFSFPYEGSYIIKVVDSENNNINYKGSSLIRIEVK